MASSLARRIRRKFDAFSVSPAGLALPVALLAGHVRRTSSRTAWTIEGRDALEDQLREDGPVILVMWHGRLLASAHLWEREWGRIISLTSTAFPGQLGGRTFTRFGIETQALHDKKPGQAEMRAVARAVKEGASLILQADGPEGPARQAKAAPLDWARITGRPIWLAGASFTRFRQLDSWDRMLVPRAGGRGAMVYRPWGHAVPRRVKAEEMDVLRARLTTDLDAVTEAADRAMGHSGLIA